MTIMKITLRRFLPFLIILAFTVPLSAQEKLTWSVYFSPNGGCIEAIIKEVDRAKTSVLVQTYSFTSAPIAKGLLNVVLAATKKISIGLISLACL